jgi:hypothetical protein
MAHFAEIDSNLDNVVLRVLVIGNEDILDENGEENEALGITYCKSLFGEETEWVQTSYNNNFRKNYAGTGWMYDEGRDAFIPPQPYASWTLNEDTCQYNPPVEPPNITQPWLWDEATVSWVLPNE